MGQSDRSLLNNINFDKKYENVVAAIFGKNLASLDKDKFFMVRCHRRTYIVFSFECELAAKVISTYKSNK